MVNQQILNHVQLTDLKNMLWVDFNKYFGQTSQKNQFEHNLKFITPNGMDPIDLDSPFKCLALEINPNLVL